MIFHLDCSQINGLVVKHSKRCLQMQQNLQFHQVLFHELIEVASAYSEHNKGKLDGFEMTIRIVNGAVEGRVNESV
ncbi:MAG TPA: hypothetical protein V6C76_11855 [Drouetiella sp.]